MHPYLSQTAAEVRSAELRAARPLWSEPSRRGAHLRGPGWALTVRRRFAAWAERPRAGRTPVVCCPA